MKAQRNIFIDVLKGYAILLVVLGHAVQYNLPKHFDETLIFRVIYSFHMPLFMFLSGYVNYGTFDGSFKKLGKRLQALLIPYVTWFFVMFGWKCLLAWIHGGEYPDFVHSLTGLWKSPDRDALWFLWVLALNCILLFFALRISSRYEVWVLAIFYLLLNLLVWQLRTGYLGLVQLAWHVLFFGGGYAVAKHKTDGTKVFQYLSYLALPFFLLLVLGWHRTAQMPLCVLLIKGVNLQHCISYCYTLLVPLLGILGSFCFAKWLLMFSVRVKDTLTCFGRLTLEIYSTHFVVFTLVFVIRHYPFWIQLLLSSFAALTFSFYFQWWVKKWWFTAYLFYGKPKSRTQKND